MNFKQWLLLTEAKKSSDIARELLGNNETLFNKIKSDIPKDIKPDLQAKLLPIAAYYYKQQPNTETLKQDIKDYAELVKLNKMPIITVKDDLTIDNKHFQNYLHWTQIIHGKQAEDKILNAPIPQGDLEDQELIEKSTDGRIKVYKANSVSQCIILGKGESFCVSQPANTAFQSYRDIKVSTFYFVYDNTRIDDLAIVVIDVTEHGIELTDRKNQTAETMQDPYSNTPKRIQSNPQLYFKYLKEHGIDTSVFINIPRSKEEAVEQGKLGKRKHDLQWFKSLTPEEKSKYIGRGHLLSNEQFDYLYENKFMLLLTQYVRIGRKINDYQLEKVAKVRDLKDKYLHNRLIANQQENDLSKQEYELLSPKQKEEFFNVDADKKSTRAILISKLEKLKEAIKDGAKINDYFVSFAAVHGNLDIVKYLVEEKDAKIGDSAVSNAAWNNNFDILKYLVEKGAEIGDYAVSSAADNGHLDMVKYLVDKGANIGGAVAGAVKEDRIDIVKYLVGEKNARIDDFAVSNAAENGNLDIVKYLVDKGAKINDYSVRYAAENGHLNVIKYFVDEKDIKIGNYVVTIAAEKGHLDIVKYLVEKDIKIDDSAVSYAARYGHFDVVKYLVEKGAKISDSAVANAAASVNLDMVKYLVEKGAYINDHAVFYAAANGNLELAKYLVEKGAKITYKSGAIKYAKTQEIKDYLLQKEKEQQT